MNSLDKWARSFAASCIRKKRYRTEGKAKSVAEKVLNERGVELHCYYCTQCAGYHLTSRPPKNKKEGNERIF